MIEEAIVAEIRRMLGERKCSQRKIAERLGVSRGTVNAVACGRRRDYPTRRQPRDGGFQPPSGPPVRCPGCGGVVQMPCLLCYIRARGVRSGQPTAAAIPWGLSMRRFRA